MSKPEAEKPAKTLELKIYTKYNLERLPPSLKATMDTDWGKFSKGNYSEGLKTFITQST